MQSHKKILIAESDEVVRALIRHILERQGFHVEAVSDCAQLLEKVRQHHYDAVILDLAGKSGAVAVLEIAKSSPQVMPRVIVTTSAMEAAEPLSELPLCSVVKKPVEIGDFVDLVRRCAQGA